LLPFYKACESVLPSWAPIVRFKHMSGEYPTATAFALWLASKLPAGAILPGHMVKHGAGAAARDADASMVKMGKRVLIYNTYKGMQHSFMLLSKNN
jgi:hypothetical protein